MKDNSRSTANNIIVSMVKVIRVALDKLVVTYSIFLLLPMYDLLRKKAANHEPLLLKVKLKRGFLELELKHQPRKGRTGMLWVDTNEGVEIEFQRPPPADSPKPKGQPLGLTITLQGRAYSSQMRGRGLTKRVMRAIEREFYAHVGSNAEERRKLVAASARVRELHLASDAIVPECGIETTMLSVFAGGNTNVLFTQWVSRSKRGIELIEDASTSLTTSQEEGERRDRKYNSFGTTTGGQTITLGRDLRTQIYERDRCKKNFDRLSPLYEKLGVGTKDRVLRVEFQAHARFLRTLKIGNDPIHTLPAEFVLSNLHEVGAQLVRRVRHVNPGTSRKTRRKTSDFWRGIVNGVALLGEAATGSIPAPVVRKREQHVREQKAVMALARKAAELVKLGYERHQAVAIVATHLGVPFANASEPPAAEVRVDHAPVVEPALPEASYPPTTSP